LRRKVARQYFRTVIVNTHQNERSIDTVSAHG
jgi:hypothetical protein